MDLKFCRHDQAQSTSRSPTANFGAGSPLFTVLESVNAAWAIMSPPLERDMIAMCETTPQSAVGDGKVIAVTLSVRPFPATWVTADQLASRGLCCTRA